MKMTMQIFNKIFIALIAILFITCAEPDYPTPEPIVTVQTSKVTTYHAIADGPRIQLKIDNVANAKDTLRYELKNGKSYNVATLAVPSGPNRIISASDLVAGTTLVSDRNPVVSGTSYSYFIINRIQKINNVDQTVAAIRRITDDLAPADVGFAKVRFLNFAFDAPEVKVINTDDASTTFSARKYDEVSSGATDCTKFTSLEAGTYSFEVQATSDDAVLLNINDLKLDSKGVYTIYLKGLVAGVDDTELGYVLLKH
jgi:hypothetical protein